MDMELRPPGLVCVGVCNCWFVGPLANIGRNSPAINSGPAVSTNAGAARLTAEVRRALKFIESCLHYITTESANWFR
jgi:hypothetical protein